MAKPGRWATRGATTVRRGRWSVRSVWNPAVGETRAQAREPDRAELDEDDGLLAER